MVAIWCIEIWTPRGQLRDRASGTGRGFKFAVGRSTISHMLSACQIRAEIFLQLLEDTEETLFFEMIFRRYYVRNFTENTVEEFLCSCGTDRNSEPKPGHCKPTGIQIRNYSIILNEVVFKVLPASKFICTASRQGGGSLCHVIMTFHDTKQGPVPSPCSYGLHVE
jgi:hypothetical protein